MICGHPIIIDDPEIAFERAVANGLMDARTAGMLLKLMYRVHELQKQNGTHNSTVPTSFDYRIRKIEEALGIEAPEFTDLLVTVPEMETVASEEELTGNILRTADGDIVRTADGDIIRLEP
jgi:hypothetical protein